MMVSFQLHRPTIRAADGDLRPTPFFARATPQHGARQCRGAGRGLPAWAKRTGARVDVNSAANACAGQKDGSIGLFDPVSDDPERLRW